MDHSMICSSTDAGSLRVRTETRELRKAKLIAQELRLASKESNNMIQREPHFLVV